MLPLLLLGVPLVSAQSTDLEYRVPEVPEGDRPLEVGGGFESGWYEYNNMDLRPLDEASDQAILDSDDRNAFAFTGASFDLAYRVDDDLRFVFSASHRGLWGNDQIGGTSRYGSLLYVSALYTEWSPALGGFQPVLRVGRQYYDLGGLGGARDFELSDTLDLVRLDLPFGDTFHLELIPVNVVGLTGENDRANFFDYLAQSDTQTFGFRGEHMTRRHGLVAALHPVEGLDLRAYAFYTDLGSLGTGSDISYDGTLGNFVDNDWVANVGARGAWTLAGVVTPFAGVDLSTGVDRKELVARDVACTGLALTAGARVDTRDEEGDAGFQGELSWYEAVGAAYAYDGLQYSHGHVSMKGRQAGGLVADRFMGWHPSAYVGMYGVSDDPHDIDRKSGTRVVQARARYDLPGPLGVAAGYWFFQDRGQTDLDLSQLDTIQPPYGYSTREYAAQERLGLVLGQEVDLEVSAAFGEHLVFNLEGGAFLPGAYYAIEVDEVAGDQLGGRATAWAASAGMEVTF